MWLFSRANSRSGPNLGLLRSKVYVSHHLAFLIQAHSHISGVPHAVDPFARLQIAHGIEAIHAFEETGLLWTYARDRRVRA